MDPSEKARHALALVAVLLVAACGSAGDPPTTPGATAAVEGPEVSAPTSTVGVAPPSSTEATPAPSKGEWELFIFMGGPPRVGQITDTLHVDPSDARRHVRLVRDRAGAQGEPTCESDLADDAAWRALVTALSSADLAERLSHSDDLPKLLPDSAYFNGKRGGKAVWLAEPPPTTTGVTAPVLRVDEAYHRLHDEILALPACKGL